MPASHPLSTSFVDQQQKAGVTVISQLFSLISQKIKAFNKDTAYDQIVK